MYAQQRTFGFATSGKFLDELGGYRLLKVDSAQLSYLIHNSLNTFFTKKKVI
jgi:hypothetical protein